MKENGVVRRRGKLGATFPQENLGCLSMAGFLGATHFRSAMHLKKILAQVPNLRMVRKFGAINYGYNVVFSRRLGALGRFMNRPYKSKESGKCERASFRRRGIWAEAYI